MIELRGKRVVLRTLEREDCRALWAAYEPEEPAPTEPLNPGLSVEGAERWFEEMQAKQGKEQLYLGIWHDDELVGDAQLAEIDWRHRTATVGAGIAKRSQRGKGYGSDATRTLARYAFDELDLYRLNAATHEANVGAQKALTRCGFVLEGRQREAIRAAGRRWDRLLYGLLRDEAPETT
jgi:RimJ/RimL family protein N-acetyltransferase